MGYNHSQPSSINLDTANIYLNENQIPQKEEYDMNTYNVLADYREFQWKNLFIEYSFLSAGNKLLFVAMRVAK